MRSPTKILHNGTPETYGSYSIKTEMDGRYSVCFENPSAKIQKVYFNFLGQDPAVSSNTNEKPDPVQIELQELNAGLKFIQNEQEFLLRREKGHRDCKRKKEKKTFFYF